MSWSLFIVTFISLTQSSSNVNDMCDPYISKGVQLHVAMCFVFSMWPPRGLCPPLDCWCSDCCHRSQGPVNSEHSSSHRLFSWYVCLPYMATEVREEWHKPGRNAENDHACYVIYLKLESCVRSADCRSTGFLWQCRLPAGAPFLTTQWEKCDLCQGKYFFEIIAPLKRVCLSEQHGKYD